MKKSIKVLGIISIIIIVLEVILGVWASYTDSGLGASLLIVLILLPLFGIILGAWIIGFLIFYLKKKNKRIANMIVLIGLIILGIIFIISLLGLFGIMPFDAWDVAGWFAWPFQVLILIFFIIMKRIVNSKK